AALQAVVLVEGALERMQVAVLGQPLDRGDPATVGLDGQHRARLHRLPVHQDRAGTACRGVAADVRPREAEGLPDEIDEQLARLHLGLVGGAVDGYGDLSQGTPPSTDPYVPELRSLSPPCLTSEI